MDIGLIVIVTLTCLVVGQLRQSRSFFLFLFTLTGLSWSQDSWFPVLTFALAWLAWMAITPSQNSAWFNLEASLGFICLLFFSPNTNLQAILWMGLAGLGLSVWMAQANQTLRLRFFRLVMVGVVGFFLVNKATVFSLEWLGLSYLILRLLILAIDGQRVPPMTFPEFVIYLAFPLTLLSGPIDRPERMKNDFLNIDRVSKDQLLAGLERITWGLAKKFVLADSLALIALSPQLAEDTQTIWGAWLTTYAYALRLYWDFSGYTDLVIGLGLWAGFHLPENFKNPYLKPNLALFWQNWHITLTDWFRTYVFLPSTRFLLRRKLPISTYFVAQVLTLILIAAWHGLTLNFLLWGLWHAVGLYLHRLWGKWSFWNIPTWLGVIITFHYVVLGWVWFALPTPQMSLEHFGKLFGL